MSNTGVTMYGPSKVTPPSEEWTTRYWSSSGVSPLRKPTQRSPVVGLTVGTDPWLSSHWSPPADAPTQNAAEPLMIWRGAHERPWSSEYEMLICELRCTPAGWKLNRVHVTYRRSTPIGAPGAHATGACDTLKHCGETPAGRGPEVMYSLSLKVMLKFGEASLSWSNWTTPSPGWRGSFVIRFVHVEGEPGAHCALLPPTRARDHVKPPFVDRCTNTPFESLFGKKPSIA